MKKLMFLSMLALLLVSCDAFQAFQPTQKKSSNGMNVVRINYFPDYSHFTVDVKMDESLKSCLLTDSSNVKIKTTEWMNEYEVCSEATRSQLIDVTNLKAQELSKLHLTGLVLVDLTLSPEAVERERTAVIELKSIIPDGMYVAFINKDGVSETLPVTPYVLKNYFNSQETSEKPLYRSILCKLDEMNGHSPRYYPSVPQDSSIRNLPLKQKFMVVLSDGNIYKDNLPIDPLHYELEQALIQSGDSMTSTALYYVNYNQSTDADANIDINPEDIHDARPIMELVCRQTNGLYFENPNWKKFTNDLLSNSDLLDIDYRFTFLNPDFKVYRGQKRFLQIECFAGDSLYASTVEPCILGSIYNPLIVNGLPTTEVILQGILLSALIMLFIYVIMQFVVPYIRYQYFKKKYVTHYISQNTSYNGMLVGQSCYYCKAPFEKGDEIIVKCKHVLHKLCWDENEHKCPEFGRNCKSGSHYYNQSNLLDKKNATFYLTWTFYSILAGLLAWILFIWRVQFQDFTVVYLTMHIYNLSPNTPEAAKAIEKYGSQLFFLPSFGFAISLFLTFFLSLLVSYGHWKRRLITCSVKALIAAIGGGVAFIIGCVISLLLDLDDNSFLIDWMPWCLIEFTIAFAVAYGTEIRLKRVLKGAAIATIFGLGSMYFWSFTYERGFDSRLLCLFSYLIYGVGLGVSIASISPRSEHYFLRVTGAIKEIDIALYKWMNAPYRTQKITIGKSVNCDLQISWDLQGDIAPIQAEIKRINGCLYLFTIEKGVELMGKPLKANVKKHLYHGDSFKIARTTFTYIEKDV
ncbi:MAG: hypothetical protein RR382_01110 [Tannerellaceae bacterium]